MSGSGWVESRKARRGGLALLVLFLVAAPLYLPSYPLFILSLSLVNIIAVQGVNLAMGYAGQVSLGHAGFCAIGGYASVLLVVSWGFSYWPALLIGGVLAGAVGYLLGFPALRLGPLYVAMVTFGFGLVVMLIAQNWIDLTNGPNGIVLPPPEIFGASLFAEEFHYPVAVITVVLFLFARNLVDSRIGRAFVAIRESELAAQAMGVNLVHYKTLAFALGAFFGGVSGGLFSGLSQYVNPDAFVFLISILYVLMALLGGMGSLAGAAVGGLMLTVLTEILRGAAEYKDFLTGLLLLVLIVFLPRGLMGLVSRMRGKARLPVLLAGLRAVQADPGSRTRARQTRGSRLQVENLSIRFGGLAALQGVSLEVKPGEILGLIGPNGAGKTTMFNLISGLYRPDSGRMVLDEREISSFPTHQRTRLGIARTFQNLELFDEMSVLDNVLVGFHARISGRLIGTTLRTPSERREENEILREAMGLLDFVGLASYADHWASSLPFGHQRMLEIARALAVNPRLLLLDEPAAGLSAAELETQMGLIRRVREERGISILLIGHTMRLVMGLSDRVVVLDHGEKIAEGPPAEIQRNPRVIEAYLGTADGTAPEGAVHA